MSLRIGIDVGGTFTKAVAIDGSTGELLGKATSPTTYDRDRGVAAGVVAALQTLLATSRVQPSDVRLVVLSTTQAVNALLEGDVTTVGVIGMAPSAQRGQAEKRTRVGDIKLARDRSMQVLHEFLETDALDRQQAAGAIERLAARGARAIVASSAYAVDDPKYERLVLEEARSAGLPATAGHEMTGLYGLEVRTFTAAVNACILPQMSDTLRQVRAAIAKASISAPLMVMHGDMEIVDSQGPQLKPAATVLSGPAASVAGALMYHKVADALFLEVGGTSTNIGVVRHGRPAIRYVRIMDHPTCVRSVDVHVAGVAGGSLLRVHGRKVADVGPRSAHVADLPYASFVAPGRLAGARLVTTAPKAGDPADYACVETDAGERFGVTLTDAANALGLIPEGDYARGNRESARIALGAVAGSLGLEADVLARRMLDIVVDKVRPLVRELVRDYKLKKPDVLGLGGAASVLVPSIAADLHTTGHVVQHAEVISSIGVAMLPVGLEWERAVRDGSPAEVSRLIEEAEVAAIAAGAEPASVQVTVTPVPERGAVRIRAVGTARGAARGDWGRVDDTRAADLAAATLSASGGAVERLFENRFYRVYSGRKARGIRPFRSTRTGVTVVDQDGAIPFTTDDGAAIAGNAAGIAGDMRAILARRRGTFTTPPRVVLIDGPRLVDLPAGAAANAEEFIRRTVASSEDRIAVVVSYDGA